MSDTNSNQTLMALLSPETEETAATDDAAASFDGHGTPQLPTLDQRTDMFLRAVYGPHHPITPEMRSAARDRLIGAMAADLADKIMGPPPAPVRTSAAQLHGMAAQRTPAMTAGLSQLWASLRQHCQTLLPPAEAFTMRGLRMAAVPLVALLVVSSVWTTSRINQRDYSTADQNFESNKPPSATAPMSRARGLSPQQPVNPQTELNARRDIAATEAALGPTNPVLARKLVDLATLLHADGRYAEAEALCTRALTIDQEALGPKDHETVRTITELAKIYRAQGRTEEADGLLARANQP
jgi:hypothetical protein